MKKLIFFLLCAPVFATYSFAETCSISPDAKPIESITASAGKWANLRNSPGSLKFESDRLLTSGYQLLTDKDPSKKIPTLILKSAPTKFLSSYSDAKHCEEKLTATTSAPIAFNGMPFKSIQDLTKWFGDFSQGSGIEGKKLYEICDGSCSPQYTLVISEKAGGLSVDASAICGHARDKDDDTYSVKILSGAACK